MLILSSDLYCAWFPVCFLFIGLCIRNSLKLIFGVFLYMFLHHLSLSLPLSPPFLLYLSVSLPLFLIIALSAYNSRQSFLVEFDMIALQMRTLEALSLICLMVLFNLVPFSTLPSVENCSVKPIKINRLIIILVSLFFLSENLLIIIAL